MVSSLNNAPRQRRVFSRQSLQPKVYQLRWNPGSTRQQEASLLNKGEGGVYLEVPEFLKTGTRIQLSISESDSRAEDHEGPELQKLYWASVRWCHELQSPVKWRYGAGVVFLSNECEWCSRVVPYDRIHFTRYKITLCDHCFQELHDLHPGRLGASLTNYLLGNVV